jgi:hypothetical protein
MLRYIVSMGQEKEYLAQRWVHSHEEDTDQEMVFRPASFNFPLSRGRRSIDIKPNGSVLESGPGPTDRTEIAEGAWKLAGDQLTLTGAGKSNRQYRIMTVDPEKLVIQKPTG